MVCSPLPRFACRLMLVLAAGVLLCACNRGGPADKNTATVEAQSHGQMPAGLIFSDRLKAGQYGPELVVVPAGSFQFGAVAHDKKASAREQPAHEVRFAQPFAISRTEITVTQFQQFIRQSGYRSVAEQQGRSEVFDLASGKLIEGKAVDWRHDQSGRPARGDVPVLHVAFADANAYAAWLSKRSGKRYRLPSEAEWEYVLRAGSSTVFPWGDKAKAVAKGNLTGDGDRFPNGRNWRNAIRNYRDGYWAVAPVRQYSAEAFGSFDMLGNVSEWVEDCWHENYRRAPANGEAWVNPGCSHRVVRGSAWLSAIDQSRASFRMPAEADDRNARLGFRLVREL
jgi:formylglycine-generating enzyme required for sulfatase activity